MFFSRQTALASTILISACVFGGVVRVPGPGGVSPSSGIQPPPDITVSGFTQTSIQNALNQCTGLVGHRTILFPAGTYAITSTMELPTPTCTLYGVQAQSILDGTSCGGCYIFHGGTNGVNDTIYNLSFNNGGIRFDSISGQFIHHNAFQNIQTQYAISALGGISNATIDSNVLANGTTLCPSPCGSVSPTFIQTNGVFTGTTITNNYISGAYQGIVLLGGSGNPGSGNTIATNTFQNIIAMGIQSTAANSNTTINNNYFSNWRTQNETTSPPGSTPSFAGQNPTSGCPNFPNGSGSGTNGGGNRYDCNSFGISVIGGGSNVTINNNKMYGLTDGSVSLDDGIQVVVSSGQVRNNVLEGFVYNIYDNGLASSASTTNNSGNISCGLQNPNPGTGGGNVWFSNCSNSAIPAPDPVPNPPFNPGTVIPPGSCVAATFTQSAIQSCLNLSSIGGTVYLPAGTYPINTSGLSMPSHSVTITGVRAKSILQSASGTPLITLTDNQVVSNLVFQNGCVVFNGGGNTASFNKWLNNVCTYALQDFGAFNNLIDSNVSVYTSVCTALCTSHMHWYSTLNPQPTNVTVSNNYIDGYWEAVQFLGYNPSFRGANVNVHNNTMLHGVRMAVENGTPIDGHHIDNNYMATWATIGDADNDPANCGVQTVGDYSCNSFAVSMAGGASTAATINGNRAYGSGSTAVNCSFGSRRGCTAWGIEMTAVAGQLTVNGNTMSGPFVDAIWDDAGCCGPTGPNRALTTNNTLCNVTNAASTAPAVDGWGTGNTYSSSCATANPVPCPPFDVTTGGAATGCGGVNTVLLSSLCAAGTGGNDTTCIQNAMNQTATAGQRLRIAPSSAATYLIDPVFVPSNANILLDSGTAIKARPGYTTFQRMININSVSTVQIVGTAGSSIFSMPKAEYTSDEYRHCMGIDTSNNVTLTGFSCNDSGGDGIYITGNSTGVTMDNITLNNNRRNGLTIISATNVNITNSHFTNTNGTAPQAGVDIEPNVSTDRLVNINFTDSFSSGNSGNGFAIDPRNLLSTSSNVSITLLRHGSTLNGRNGYFVTNQHDTPGELGAGGTINIQNCTTTLEQYWGFQASFYNASGPAVNVTGINISNVNRSGMTYDNSAVGITRGGGGVGPIGNVFVTGATISETLGQIDYYFDVIDFSSVGYSHIQFLSPTSLSGQTAGHANGLFNGSPVASVNVP